MVPERGTIFTVAPKGRRVSRCTRPGRAVFDIHQINCFERDDAILFDVPAYPKGRHMSNLYLDRRLAAEALETSRIKRYTVPLNGNDVTGEILFGEFAELPMIDYARDAGLDYGMAYAASGHKDRPKGFYNQLLRFDLRGHEVRRWFEDGCLPGEPVFLPRPRPKRRSGWIAPTLRFRRRRMDAP